MLAELARRLPDLRHIPGSWIQFEDAGGPGWAQPDLIVVGAARALVVEAKLTHCLDARLQLQNLYLPLVRHLFPDHDYGILEVCRFPKPDETTIWVEDPEIALLFADQHPRYMTWHWLP